MKQFMYILVLLLFGAQHYTAQAQEGPYKSIFGKDSTRWSVVYEGPYAVVPPIHFNEQIIIMNDTVVNTLTYKKMYLVQMFDTSQFLLNHIIREDTMEGKVWARKKQDTKDYLLYDFSLNAGDTFVGLMDNSYSAVVDSTATIAGKKRIYLTGVNRALDYAFHREYPLVFIEGIGAVGGELFNIVYPVVGAPEYLLCSYKDGVQDMAYVNEKYGGDCYPNLSRTSVAALHKQQVSIAPNPALQQVQLAQLPAIEHTITLLDVQGRVLERAVNASPSYLLDVAAYAPGMYILRVDAAGYSPYVQKIEKR